MSTSELNEADTAALKRLTAIFEANETPISESEDQRREILSHFITAISKGDLEINGQAPDKNYALGEYLIHGGRILFDLTGLDDKQRKDFLNYLMPPDLIKKGIIDKRVAATHTIQKNEKGEAKDVKQSPLKAFVRGITSYFSSSHEHYGMDIAIGGAGNKINNYRNKEITVQSNGEFGHLYMNRNSDVGIQMGIEEAGALKTNAYSGDFHSPTGHGGKYSAFNTARLDNLHDYGTRAPLITSKEKDSNAKYNWNVVKITPENIDNILGIKTDPKTIPSLLIKPHEKSIEVNNIQERQNKMLEWRKEQGYLKEPAIKTSKPNPIISFFKKILQFFSPEKGKESEISNTVSIQNSQSEAATQTKSSTSNISMILAANTKSAIKGLTAASEGTSFSAEDAHKITSVDPNPLANKTLAPTLESKISNDNQTNNDANIVSSSTLRFGARASS